MTNKQLIELLKSKGACMDARKWIGRKSAKTAWQKCERSDWLFWICGALGVDRKQIVLAACACARLALPFVKKGEDRPRVCIETTERWVRGEATIEQVKAARVAAAAYASAAYAAAAAAAYAAAAAAAHAAAADAYAAAYAAASAAASAARQKMHQDCCAAIRRVIKFEDVLKLAKDL